MTALERTNALRVVVTSTVSDAHTWNLIFLQLLLEELGHVVDNLGSCVPPGELVAHCAEHKPDLVVFSTVNGHGYADGIAAIRELRAVAAVPAVIGGKLGIDSGAHPDRRAKMLAAGFDAVFEDDSDPLVLKSFMRKLALSGAP
jgi:methylaspartate mutase sigma subunit